MPKNFWCTETTVFCKNLPPTTTVKDVAAWIPINLLPKIQFVRVMNHANCCQVGTKNVEYVIVQYSCFSL